MDLRKTPAFAGLFRLAIQANRFVRLQTDHKTILSRGPTAERRVRHLPEIDDDLRDTISEAFARAQEERHARPAPVLDLDLERDERLGRAVGGHAGFRRVARYGIAANHARVILAAYGELADIAALHGFE